jgi:4,5-dihydroxyphthalate decarboxylase
MTLIAKHPDLAADVFNAFAEAKRRYLDRLSEREIEKPTAVDEMHRRVMEITGDPLPYGLAAQPQSDRRTHPAMP